MLSFAGGVGTYRKLCDDVAAKGYEGFALDCNRAAITSTWRLTAMIANTYYGPEGHGPYELINIGRLDLGRRRLARRTASSPWQRMAA